MRAVRRDPNKGYLDSWLWVPKQFVNVEGVKSALSFEIPDAYSENKVQYLFLYEETDYHLLVPRALWDIRTLPFPVLDCRPTHYSRTGVRSKIKLDHKKKRDGFGRSALVSTGRVTQKESVEALQNAQGGILQLACGLGKTVVFLHFIAQLQVPALIVVDTSTLLSQWEQEINDHLDVPGGIGIIKGDKMDWQKNVVIATYQTLAARADQFPEEARRWFGVIGWDEGHHIGAPTFAKSAALFYGRRYALTATPKRDDGCHVIYNFHIGDVLYRDLTQELKPRVVFRWTGLHLDETMPYADVRDIRGELHLSKLAVFYARWEERTSLLMQDIRNAVTSGRKVLVLSNSVDEAVNLMAKWTLGSSATLYTDVPHPTQFDVGETIPPIYLTGKELSRRHRELERIDKRLEAIEKGLSGNRSSPSKVQQLKVNKEQLVGKREEIEDTLRGVEVGKKIQKELRKRQRNYLRKLLPQASDAGLLIYKAKPDDLESFLAAKKVVFAITKYGKEGLDDQALDTILVSVPFSSQNGLQQLMGRPSRADNLKKHPLVVIYEDDIGPMIGMCQKLRNHLRSWPHEENGPYDYELFGHPMKWGSNKTSLF